MFQRHKRTAFPQLNTTSTADISFILLVFFLVMTSMDIDKGLSRQLPPTDNDKREEVTDVKKGNLLELQLTPSGQLFADGKLLNVDKLRSRTAHFIAKAADRRSCIITLDVDRNAPYDAYFKVQNELMAAYNTLRDRYALRTYGQTYARCTAEQRENVRKHYPQRIVETTSEGVKGGAE